MKVARAFVNRMSPTSVLGLESFDGWAFVYPRATHDQARDVRIGLLGVGDRTLQDGLDVPGTPLLAEFQRRQCLVDGETPNHVGDEPGLPRGDAGELMGGFVCHDYFLSGQPTEVSGT